MDTVIEIDATPRTGGTELSKEVDDKIWKLHCAEVFGSVSRTTDEKVKSLIDEFAGFVNSAHLPVLFEIHPEDLRDDDCDVFLTGPGRASTAAPGSSGIPNGDADAAKLVRGSFAVDATKIDAAMLSTIINFPSIVLALLGYLRCARWCRDNNIPTGEELLSASSPLPLLTCKVLNLNPMPFADLGARSLNTLVTVIGTVISLGLPRLVCRQMPFTCGKCGKQMNIVVENGILIPPTGCETQSCKSYVFLPNPENAVLEEVQIVRLQENSDSSTVPAGGGQGQGRNGSGIVDDPANSAVARILEVVLTGEWMETVVAGDIVKVSGLVSSRRQEKKQYGGIHHLSIKAKLVDVLSGTTKVKRKENGDVGDSAAPLTQETLSYFQRRASNVYWLDTLTKSICPHIFGHDRVKQSLVLSLIGGTPKDSMRSNIHLVMVGDPGMGKSQLLRAASNASPRTAFVSANTASACGLTLTLSRDASSGESVFEAGAVVHGDGGTTCIDEIDKGSSEHKALLEVMEQETLSMAKAGMVFTMPIKTTILAAGNPVGGRFAPERSIADNINMSSALLSRFDFVWLLKDTPGQDRGITNHVLNLHREKGPVASSQQQQRWSYSGGNRGTAGELLSPQQIADFVRIAREFCHPRLSKAASDVLMQAYIEHRNRTVDFASVTPRHLQSMIRIAEARAKVDLREEVTSDDAKFAVKLLNECHASAQQATNGQLGGNSGKLSKAKATKEDTRRCILTGMQRMMLDQSVESLPESEVLQLCREFAPANRDPRRLFAELSDATDILLQPGNRYKVAPHALKRL